MLSRVEPARPAADRRDGSFASAFRTTSYENVDALRSDLDRWLAHYTTERPHQGYRNVGRRPIETVQQYIKSVPEAA